MDKAAILARLREHEPALRERGASHAAVFGSRARGDHRPDSGIDILVEIGPMSLWGYVGLTQFIEGLFPEPVDVADRSRLKPLVGPTAEREAIYAF
jgi:predicted nucleotidyltransferase